MGTRPWASRRRYNARSHADRLRKTQRPEVLTLNGAAELVVQNAEAYQTMLDRLDELETLAALNVAAAEIDRGEGPLARTSRPNRDGNRASVSISTS